MAKSKERGAVSGRLKKGGRTLQKGGMKHRRKSRSLAVPGRVRQGGFAAAAKAKQSTDRPMLGESKKPVL